MTFEPSSSDNRSSDSKSYRRDPKKDKRRGSSSAQILDRSPPFDLSAEMGVLGSILLNPDVCNDLAMILRSDDFYDDANRKLYHQVKSMYEAGQKIDATLLVSQLKSAGEFDLIGGAAYLAKLANSVPNAAHASYYAQIVRSKATLRRLIEASTSILQDAYEETQDVKELVSQAEQRIFQIQDERSANSASSIADVLKLALGRIDARMKGEDLDGGVATHFVDFDNMTGGLHNGELIILAARPSMGKTAFAMNIADQVAMQGKSPVLFVSLEMSAIELADRLLCSVARVNGRGLRTGAISNDDRQKLIRHAMEVSQAPLYVDDAPSRTVSEIAAVARRITQQEQAKPTKKRLSLIVIDYLQLIEPDSSKDPRQEQVAKIARRLKMMARELEVPVLCLAQLNRQAEEGKDHTPRLSHLRESGAIEQDADVVMFVHREEYFHRAEAANEFHGQAQIIIAKQRNGPVGEVELIWEREYTRFLSKAPERHADFDNMGGGGFSTPGGY